MKSLAMNNFIFKSSKGLIKNSSLNLDDRMKAIQQEQRHQRSDLKDVKLMLNKILIDKHLQAQVDDYFEDEPIPEDTREDLDWNGARLSYSNRT